MREIIEKTLLLLLNEYVNYWHARLSMVQSNESIRFHTLIDGRQLLTEL